MPKTLLLADDSVTIQKVVGISFANEDVVLLTVDNGDDAIVRAREARPDLVLADVMMPGKDGYEVCEALKADPELRHVPVLLLSGTFEPFDEERARRAGADGHITKPFEAQALVDQVNALLARPAPSPDAPSGDATVVVSPGDEDAADSAFDFFEEEMAQTAPAPKVAAALAPPPTVLAPPDDEPLELEAAVEDDESALRPAPEPVDAGRADDSQATVLFDDGAPGATRRSGTPPPFLGDGFDPEALATPELPAAPAPPHAPAPAGYEESFDFGFDDGAATATTLAAAVPAATPPPPPAPPGASAPPPVEAATELFDDDEPEPFGVEAVPAPAAVPTPPPFVAAPPPLPPSFEPAPPPVPASAASEPLAVRVSGPPAAVALSEPIQQQLQQTLEKIVWEAFGDLTERIVRDVIERVEAVAWEVLPQMAETLIREEIRRLKDGDE